MQINAQQKKIRVSEPVGFFAKLLGGNGGRSYKKDISVTEVRTVKPRKAPIKIEPKVFFSNERTFLAWMHVSVILAGASVAILAISDYENIGKQVYGLIMLPVAVAFLVYAMNQCRFSILSIRGFYLTHCECDCFIWSSVNCSHPANVFCSYDVRKSRWPIIFCRTAAFRRQTKLHDPTQASWTVRGYCWTDNTCNHAHDFNHRSVCYQTSID
jgi:uncharacterized membrane protein YidH (DUF202 family)